MSKTACLALTWCWLLGAVAVASAQEPTPTTQPQPLLPHVRIDREARAVEIDAKVVNREAQWLELLVCSPGSREHETILTSPAKPSHVHLALLTIGLQPGAPMSWRRVEQQVEIDPPRGPALRVVVLETRDGKTVRHDANQWIIHQQTRQVMPDNHWLFMGSQFVQIDGNEVYRADLGGTLISLVNFGDDLVGRPTTTTNMDDQSMWGCRTEAIPPVGTAVVVRLEAVAEAASTAPAATQPAEASK